MRHQPAETPEDLLQLVRGRWIIEGWQWICVTQLDEDAHRDRVNGTETMAMVLTAVV